MFIPLIAVIISIYIFKIYNESPKAFILREQSELYNKQLIALNNKLDSFNTILIKGCYKNDNSFRSILQLDTVPLSIREAGTGGTENTFHLKNFGNSSLLLKVAKKIDKINRQLIIQEKSYDEIDKNIESWIQEINNVPSIMPISVTDLVFISSTFGMRSDPFLHESMYHKGYDYVAPIGTKVYATGNGIVTLSKYSRKGYGNEVIIDHSFGFSTRYAHLSQILVEEGDSIKRGQVIGLVGTTGRSTGPHLHYEVRYLNRAVNPFYYYSDDLSGEEYEMMVRNNNSKN